MKSSGPLSLFLLLALSTSQLAAQAPRTDLHGDPLPEGAIARLGTIRLRPGVAAKHLAFTADSKQLVCWAGADDTPNALVVYDVAGGKEIRRDELLDARAAALTVLPDGRGLAVVSVLSIKNRWLLWEFTDAKAALSPPKVPQGENFAYGNMLMAISPDGRWVASCGGPGGIVNKPVEVRPWRSGRLLFDEKPTYSWDLGDRTCNRLLFTHDSKELLVVCSVEQEEKKHEVVVIALTKAKPRPSFPLPRLASYYLSPLDNNIAVAPNQRLLALGPLGDRGFLLDFSGDKEPRSLPLPTGKDGKAPGHLFAVAFSPDGRFLVASSGDRFLRCWDLDKPRLRWEVRGTQWYNQLTLSPDGRWIAGADSFGLVTLWQAANGAEASSRDGLKEYPGSLEVSADGRSAFTSGGNSGLRQWDLRQGKLLRENSSESYYWGLALPPGGNQPIVAHEKGMCQWNIANNRLEAMELEKRNSVPYSFGFSADGKSLVSLDKDIVSIWDWPQKTLRRRWSFADPKMPDVLVEAWQFDLSKDGGRLLTITSRFTKMGEVLRPIDTTVDLWDAKDGKKLWTLDDPPNPQRSVSYGRTILVPDQKGIVLATFGLSEKDQESLSWIEFSGAVRRKFSIPAKPPFRSLRLPSYLAISPDGRTLAGTGWGGDIVLYEMASGLPRRVLRGHRNYLAQLAFTPDGRRLVTFSSDLTGLVWDLSLAAQAKAPATAKELHQAWDELTNRKDGAKVHQAMVTLSSAPKEALTMIGKHLRPAVAPDAKRIARLVAELDDADFGMRTKAFAELDRLGEGAIGLLREHLKKPQPLEVTRRLERLLDKHDPPDLSEQRLRAIRALEIIEGIATPDARKLLEALAKGAPLARRTHDAVAALRRLGQFAKASHP